MNIRLQNYKKNRIKGMSQYNAAIAAGYSHHTATKASRLDRKLDDLKDYLERAGLTDLRLSEFLMQALEAKKIIGYLHQYKKGEKGIEQVSPDEIISNEFLDTEDWPVRLKATELILRIKGALKDKIEHTGLIKETKIYIITGATSGFTSNTQRLPSEISI